MGKLVLHIGVPKSGTTYIQGILAQNRSDLEQQGWRYPGGRSNQQHAIYGLCGKDIAFLETPEIYTKAGLQLKKRVRELCSHSDSAVLLSAEVLSMLSDEAIDRFVSAIGPPDKILVTIRGLHALLLSTWQQSLKTGHVETLPKSIDRFEKSGISGGSEWYGLLYGDVIRRWSRVGRVETVVVPKSRPKGDEYWQLFRRAAQIEPVPNLTVDDENANISLSREAAAILRQINVQCKNGTMSRQDADRLRKSYLRDGVFPLAGGKDGGERLQLNASQRERIMAWNDAQLQLVNEHSHATYGDPMDLLDAEPLTAVGSLRPERVAFVAAAQVRRILAQRGDANAGGALDGGETPRETGY